MIAKVKTIRGPMRDQISSQPLENTSYQATHHHQSTTEQGHLVGAVAGQVLPPVRPHESLLHQHHHLNHTILHPSQTHPRRLHCHLKLVWYQTDRYHALYQHSRWLSLLHRHLLHPLFRYHCHCHSQRNLNHHQLQQWQQHLYQHPMPHFNTARSVIQTAPTATAGLAAQLWQHQLNLPQTLIHPCH